MTVSYSYHDDAEAPGATFGFCTQQTEEQDGIGIPGPPTCGSGQISTSALYVWGVDNLGI